MMRNLWALCAIPLFAVGCTSTDSTYVATSEIYAELIANATGNGQTEVEATLHRGGIASANFVDLEGGDVLRATRINASSGAELTETMVEHQAFGVTWYTAEFSTQDEDTGFRVDFDRDTETSAMGSTATLPGTFDMSWVDGSFTTAAPEPFSRASTTEYYVIWDPSAFATGDRLSYEVTGSCIKISQGNLNWAGGIDVLQLADSFLLDADPPNDGQSCLLTVTLTLTRDGTIASAYGGGSFIGVQSRTLTIQSTP